MFRPLATERSLSQKSVTLLLISSSISVLNLKTIEEEWLDVFRNHLSKDGLSATAKVTGEDEWLCEAYMKTDYTTLREDDFQQTLNNYLAYLLKEGKIYES